MSFGKNSAKRPHEKHQPRFKADSESPPNAVSITSDNQNLCNGFLHNVISLAVNRFNKHMQKGFSFLFPKTCLPNSFYSEVMDSRLCYMCKEGLGKAKSICLCGTCLCAFNHIYGSNGNWQLCSGFQIVANNIAGTFCISIHIK